MNEEQIKPSVREIYGKIAEDKKSVVIPVSSCCGTKTSAQSSGCGCSQEVDVSPDYSAGDLSAVPDGANLGLGCGTPVAFAGVQEGQTVLDLGSGAGMDVFIALKYVGTTGKVIGVDMTEKMIAKAKQNAEKIGAENVEFRLGEIESLPIDDNSIDRVISNCVINLVPDKSKAFSEIYRVLKPGGMFSVSDIVLKGTMSEEQRRDAALWAACVSGAIEKDEYLSIIRKTGFTNIIVSSEKENYFDDKSNIHIYSTTVSGTKP
jgi:arsenite methyltransferase